MLINIYVPAAIRLRYNYTFQKHTLHYIAELEMTVPFHFCHTHMMYVYLSFSLSLENRDKPVKKTQKSRKVTVV